MNWKDLGKKVAQAAPLLGGALGGPGGAAIGGLIASAFGGDPNDPEALAAKIQNDPQSAIKLREIETRHKERLEELALDRHKADLDAETKRHEASQETIRAEAEHGTDYVKNTRPKIARLSFYAGTLYALVSAAAALITLALHGDSSQMFPDPTLLGTLYGPAGFYMTMRSVDAFSRKGKT